MSVSPHPKKSSSLNFQQDDFFYFFVGLLMWPLMRSGDIDTRKQIWPSGCGQNTGDFTYHPATIDEVREIVLRIYDPSFPYLEGIM